MPLDLFKSYRSQTPYKTGSRWRVPRVTSSSRMLDPTNSGKTHDTLEAMATASTGVCLAPLRLLDLEVGESMNYSGIPCSVITGKKKRLVLHAAHSSQTIETLDPSTSLDVIVVDEVKLLADLECSGGMAHVFDGSANAYSPCALSTGRVACRPGHRTRERRFDRHHQSWA